LSKAAASPFDELKERWLTHFLTSFELVEGRCFVVPFGFAQGRLAHHERFKNPRKGH
jgi:hypothetical protein